MFDRQELAQLGEVLNTLKADMREETRALIAASENRLRKDILEMKTDILELFDSTLSQVSDLQRDLILFKRKIKIA